jgi:hypothetical protein
MMNMRPELLPAIEALKGEVADLEAKTSAAKAMTNRMCELAGVAPVYAEGSLTHQARSVAVHADQYYGKSMITAARELLEARKAAGPGPALPREIYDGLVAGGLQFDTEIETNRLTSLRAVLRKNSGIFHRLPNGQYGLLAWYPKVKAAKSEDEADGAAPPKRSAQKGAPRRKAKALAPAPTKRGKFAHMKSGQALGAEFDEFALAAMSDGKDWTNASLKQQAIEFGDVGVSDSTDLRSLNVRVLNLMRQGKVTRRGKGVWIIAKNTDAASQAGAVIHPFKATA